MEQRGTTGNKLCHAIGQGKNHASVGSQCETADCRQFTQ
jgi:hypothetical protein